MKFSETFKMTTWLEHVKATQEKHGLSYKDAMSEASKTWDKKAGKPKKKRSYKGKKKSSKKASRKGSRKGKGKGKGKGVAKGTLSPALEKWGEATKDARKKLGIKGFVPMKKGTKLYRETKKIYNKM